MKHSTLIFQLSMLLPLSVLAAWIPPSAPTGTVQAVTVNSFGVIVSPANFIEANGLNTSTDTNLAAIVSQATNELAGVKATANGNTTSIAELSSNTVRSVNGTATGFNVIYVTNTISAVIQTEAIELLDYAGTYVYAGELAIGINGDPPVRYFFINSNGKMMVIGGDKGGELFISNDGGADLDPPFIFDGAGWLDYRSLEYVGLNMIQHPAVQRGSGLSIDGASGISATMNVYDSNYNPMYMNFRNGVLVGMGSL